MKKRGIFYSIVTLVLLAPLILYATTYMDITGQQLEYKNVKMTGEKLSAYVSSIDNDLPRALEIIGKQSVATAIAQIDYSGTPLDDANMRITEMVMNGTIYGTPTNLTESTLPEWAIATMHKGVRYGFDTNVTIDNVSISAYDSFHIILRAAIVVNSSDATGKMRLDRKYNEGVLISIEGFEDPVYTLNTNGLLVRTITAGSAQGPAGVDYAVANGLYMVSSDGPSFLDRLEGRLTKSVKYSSQTPNEIGMETFVYLPEISAAGIPARTEQSMVDHYYFDAAAHAGSPVDESGYDWLRLDATHASFYGVSLIP